MLEYRWEGREYDCFCLTNILGDCVRRPRGSGCGRHWWEAAPPTGLGTSALWEAARGASGNAPDGTAWGFRRRQFIPFARQLLNLVPARVTRTGDGYEKSKRLTGLGAGHRHRASDPRCEAGRRVGIGRGHLPGQC